MTEEQLRALIAFIDARINEKIVDASGRDGIAEYVMTSACLERLRQTLGSTQ